MSIHYDEERNRYFVKIHMNTCNGPVATTIRKGIYTKEDAILAEQDYRQKHELNPKSNAVRFKDVTLDDYYYQYYKTDPDNINKIKPNTWKTKDAVYENYIKPYLGNMLILDIKKRYILSWQEEISEMTEISVSTKRNIDSILSALFSYASKKHGMHNPMNGTPEIGKKNIYRQYEYWTPAEYTKFRKVIKNDNVKYKKQILLAFDLLYYCGLSAGELQGLEIEDIDNDMLHITKRRTDSKKAKTTESRLKHDVQMPDFLKKEIYKRIEELKGNKVRYKNIKIIDVSLKLIRNKIEKYSAAAGVKKITLEGLKTSYVYLCLTEYIPEKNTAESLGISYKNYKKRYGSLTDTFANSNDDKPIFPINDEPPYQTPTEETKVFETEITHKSFDIFDEEREEKTMNNNEKQNIENNYIDKEIKIPTDSLPYGYKNENGRMVINETEAKVVRELFALYKDGSDSGMPSKEIAELFEQKGYTTRKGNLISASNIVRLWKNKDIYLGKAVKKYGQYEAILNNEYNEYLYNEYIEEETPEGKEIIQRKMKYTLHLKEIYISKESEKDMQTEEIIITRYTSKENMLDVFYDIAHSKNSEIALIYRNTIIPVVFTDENKNMHLLSHKSESGYEMANCVFYKNNGWTYDSLIEYAKENVEKPEQKIALIQKPEEVASFQNKLFEIIDIKKQVLEESQEPAE